MRARSIRIRLTAWYAAVLLVGLSLFGIAVWFALNRGLYETVDETLEDRVVGVRRFMEDQIEALSLDEIRQEFREHSVLGPGGDLFQVCDAQGNWLYRSASLADNEVSARLPNRLPKKGIYEDRKVQKTVLRFLSRPVEIRGQHYTVQVGAPMGELLEATDRFRLSLLLLIPGVLLVACAGGYWMSRRALAPVDRIIDDANAISARNLERRLEVPQSGDEMERLSRTINAMLDRLESAFRKITQFTADASHELRTPTALIRTTAELALRKKRPPAEYEEALQQVLTESERTTELIDNLLTLARADSGREGARLAPLDLKSALAETIDAGQKLAESRGLAFEVSMPDRACPVIGDATMLRRLVVILIDNALKYTPPPGSIRVSLEQDGSSAVLLVRDTGIGIAAEDLPHIFERFYRADKARGRDGGAGLGLAIAKWIVEQHRGDIRVEKSTPAQGSTFWVCLPLAGAT
ncbi:MAG: heavy metal sensor histidine kinase [Acidobacteriota bacterium]